MKYYYFRSRFLPLNIDELTLIPTNFDIEIVPAYHSKREALEVLSKKLKELLDNENII